MNDYPVVDVINLSEFLKNWVDLLEPDDVSCSECKNHNFFEYIKDHMNINEEISEELQAVCRPDVLDLQLENKYNEIIEIIPENTNLETLEHQKVELFNTQNQRPKNKTQRKDAPWKHYQSNLTCNDQNMTVLSNPDIILSVAYFRPIDKNRAMSIDLEFDVLGQQYLSELRDKLACLNDFVPIGDFTINPDAPINLTSKDLYPSAFFYIENVFYNDLRNPANVDYSKIILEWAAERKKLNDEQMTQKLMDKVRFIDLKIRLGWPYIFVHQGDCEHIFIFTDVKMKQRDDCKFRELYPLRTYKSRRKLYKCRCCRTNSAKWVVFRSELLPEDPCFLCNSCNRLLHYKEGILIATEAIICPYTAAVTPHNE